MDLMLVVAIGLIAGGVAVWMTLRHQCSEAFERGRASTDAEQAALVERIAARDRDVARLQDALSDAQSRCEAMTAQLREGGADCARLHAELDAERASTREKLAVLNEAQEQLTARSGACPRRR